MAQLAAASNFPALFPSYIAEKEEILIFKGRQTGSSYDVTTVEGRSLFVVQPMPSLGRRMKILDTSGKPIFMTRKKTFHVGNSRYFIETASQPENTMLVTLEFKMFAVGTKFTATFNNTISEHQGLSFERGYFSSEGKITDGPEGPVIAQIDRQIIMMLRKEYRAVVAPGVDMALIAGMVVCLDDQEKSHKNAPALGGDRWG